MLGPQNTKSSRTTPSYRDTLFWILQKSPMVTPSATMTFCPRMQSLPITALG